MKYDDTVKNVQYFLWDYIGKRVLRDIASEELREIEQHKENKDDITDKTIDNYITQNYERLKNKTLDVLKDTSKKLIEKSRLLLLACDIGFISIFLLIPLYPLCGYLGVIYDRQDIDYGELSSCILGIILLVVPFIAYLISIFLSKGKKDR